MEPKSQKRTPARHPPRSDRVLRSRSQTPALVVAEATQEVQVAPTSFRTEAGFQDGAPQAVLTVKEPLQLAQASKTVLSLRDMGNQPAPTSKGQPVRRSLRSRPKTPKTGNLISWSNPQASTRLETITEKATTDGRAGTDGVALKRKLEGTSQPGTKRRVGDVRRVADLATRTANKKTKMAPEAPFAASIQERTSVGTYKAAHSVVVDLPAASEIPDSAATNKHVVKPVADNSKANRKAERATTVPHVDRTSTWLTATSNTDPAQSVAAGLQSSSPAIKGRHQSTSLSPRKSNKVHGQYNTEPATASGGSDLSPPTVAIDGVAAETGEAQLQPAANIAAFSDVAALQDSRSERRITRSSKRAQSPSAAMPPPKKPAPGPTTRSAPRNPKPQSIPTCKTTPSCNRVPPSNPKITVPTPTEDSAEASPQPTQHSSSPPPPEPYKPEEVPTLMLYTDSFFSADLMPRYYQPHMQIKLEPPRKVHDTAKDYWAPLQRPSFLEMVARVEKMHNEVKWDTPELTHEYDGPKDIMDGFTGFETEAEVIAYFDRVQKEGPDLSYGPMRMPRKDVPAPKPHICKRCVGGIREKPVPKQWCECENYCGDPVGEHELAVERPVKEKKVRAKPRKRWW